MKAPGHFFISVSPNQLLSNQFKLDLPETVFPKKFEIDNPLGYCTGYFAGYENNFTSDQLFELCRDQNWQKLANSNNDFLVFYFDKSSQQTFVLMDQTEKFDLFFATEKELMISSDFKSIKARFSKLNIETDTLFTILERGWHPTEKTIFKEIKQLPPATLLTIDPTLNWQLTPQIQLDKFLTVPLKKYPSAKSFAGDFLDLFETIVKQQLKEVRDLPLACDLSSGFDCTLVAYMVNKLSPHKLVCFSGCSSQTQGDTNIPIMQRFASEHQLPLKIIDCEDRFSGNYPDWQTWNNEDILQLSSDYAYDLHKTIAHQGFPVKFNGWGGDEVYWSYGLDALGSYSIQSHYFSSVRKANFGLENILTKKGMNMFLSWERFQSRSPYPQIISTSATFCAKFLSPIFWELGIWPMTPFMDTRLVQLCRNIPKNSSRHYLSKQEIFKDRTDIFPTEMWVEKGDMEVVSYNFFLKQSEFVNKILNNSILHQAGLIDKKVILQGLADGSYSAMFSKSDLSSFLHILILIEFFLQANQSYLNINPV